MKFFPELGFCFGGASVTLSVKTTVTPPERQPSAPTEIRRPAYRNNRRRCIKVHSAMQWKPELSVIAEDSTVSDGRRKDELTGRSEKKTSVSVNANQTPAKRSSKFGNDNRYARHLSRSTATPSSFVSISIFSIADLLSFSPAKRLQAHQHQPPMPMFQCRQPSFIFSGQAAPSAPTSTTAAPVLMPPTFFHLLRPSGFKRTNINHRYYCSSAAALHHMQSLSSHHSPSSPVKIQCKAAWRVSVAAPALV